MMLALLGLSALNCSDAGAKARVEALLAKSTYVADFQKLDDEAKKQLAKDLQEVYDTLEGVAVKKSRLKTLCEPYLDRVPVKKSIDPSVKGDLKAYEKAASVSASPIPAKPHVAAGRVSVSSGSDVSSVGERVHVGRLSLDSSAPAPSPLKAPIVVSGSIKDRLALFQQQSEDMHMRVAAQKGKKDAAQDKRLLELQTALEALRGPLAEARAALEQATTNKQRTETLSKKAAEDADTAGFIQMSINLDDTALTASVKERINAEVAALFTAGIEAVAQKKRELYAAHGITDENAMQVISRLASANNFKDALFLSRFLAEDYLTKANAARLESEDANRQAVEQEAHADEILRGLADRFRLLSEEIDAMTTGK